MMSRCSLSAGWPTKSSRRRGRRVVSSAASTGSADGSSSSSRTAWPQLPERLTQHHFHGCIFVVDGGEYLAHLVGGVAEAGERLAHVGASTRRSGALPEIDVGHRQL